MDIVVGLVLSMHLGFEQELNSIHPHVRLQQDNFVAGTYYNSEKSVSAYAGVELDWGKFNQEIGIVTGYNSADILPYLRTTYELADHSQVFAAPAVDGDNIGVVMGVEFLIKN